MQSQTDLKWFHSIPKIELHLHLEGAIPLSTMWELVKKYGGDQSVADIDALKEKFRYTDFPHFIETWIWKNQFIREYDDFTLMAEAVARELSRINIRYSEVFYSPPDFAKYGLNPQEITRAIRKGIDLVPEVEVALVADLVRDFGPKMAEITLSQIREVTDQGVIGIGLGGSEQDFPAEWFADVFEHARKLGFRTTAHAGEAAGSSSIWSAINSLKVDRIGHGTRAFEDPKLVEFLSAHGIPLEVCPRSNVCTGAVNSIQKHPVRRYFEQGLSITINTDDPVMFDTSLPQEYSALVSELKFSHEEIKSLILNGIESSWLTTDQKLHLQKQFVSDAAWDRYE